MMDRAERQLFAAALRETVERNSGAALDRALAELGWAEALAVDPSAAVAELFTAQGVANASSSALGRVLAAELGHEELPETQLVLPALSSADLPGELVDERARVSGLLLGDPGDGPLLVPAAAGDNEVLVTVAVSDVTLRPVHGVDPWLGLIEVSAPAAPLTGSPEPIATGWAPAVARGRLAVSYELLGAARQGLALARTHALDRVQFGVPISTFQAVRHRLADALIAIETAEAPIAWAWQDEQPPSAAMAKALAGRGAGTASRHCQQVLAGIGFTAEHTFHRYAKRILVLDQLLGSARALTAELGTELLRTGALPPLPPL